MFKDLVQPFYLMRHADDSGVSGLGVVALGCVLGSGKVVLEWQTVHRSIGLYENLEDVKKIHGHGEDTEVILGNPVYDDKQKKKRKNKNSKV